VELLVQWDAEGIETYDPSRPIRLDPDLCTWVHTRLPEVDATGRRTTRTEWGEVIRCLRRFGLPAPTSRHRSALGAPLSDKPGVLTALGSSVVRASDNIYGTRHAVRLSRIALVPITGTVLVSGRHRDGLDWIDPVQGQAAEVLRDSALLKRDPYRITSLLASVEDREEVDATSTALELAIEVVLAATRAYPRAVIGKFNRMLSAAEASFASAENPDELDGEARPRTSLFLLQLIAAVGRLEQAMREVGDDFAARARVLHLGSSAVEDVETGFTQILASLAQLRSDTRTTVDMIGSTLSSAHLKIARAEANAAAEARARHLDETERRHATEAEQRGREQQLARTLAFLTSALLIPTLVAAVFGANVQLPRSNTEWGTYLMFTAMIGLGALSYALLREMDPTRDRPGWKMRLLPLAVAGISLAAATAIALDAPGTV
jgi:Mg2+ and Co2+ transporter CorA